MPRISEESLEDIDPIDDPEILVAVGDDEDDDVEVATRPVIRDRDNGFVSTLWRRTPRALLGRR
jgi:hypothetical protein